MRRTELQMSVNRLSNWSLIRRAVAWIFLLSIFGSLLLPAEVKAAKLDFTYRWADGPPVTTKNFAQNKTFYSCNWPRIEVFLPAEAGGQREVVLEYLWRNNRWLEESSATTYMSDNGGSPAQVAELEVQACENGDGNKWYSATFKYRIRVTEAAGLPSFAVKRFKVKFTPDPRFSSGTGGSSGSSGGGSGSFIGWNLEKVQDYLGYNPSTVDCSGSGRSVWWASNWWVIRQYAGYLVVSKSNGYCS